MFNNRKKHTVTKLPENFLDIETIDLKMNRRQAVIVNSISILITFIMFSGMLFIVPISSLFSMDKGFLQYIWCGR